MRLRHIATAAAVIIAASATPVSALQGARRADPVESRIPAGKAALQARAIGEGQPLVVLHGGPDFDYGYLLPDLDRLGDSSSESAPTWHDRWRS